MDGVDVGVQPPAPLRCCSATVHPRRGIACLHPGFWVFGLHLPSDCASLWQRQHPVSPLVLLQRVWDTPVPLGRERPCTGNDLALYWGRPGLVLV